MPGISALSPSVALPPAGVEPNPRGRSRLPVRANRPSTTAIAAAPDTVARAGPAPGIAPLIRAGAPAPTAIQPNRFSSQQAVGRYQTIGNLPDNGNAEVIPRIDRRV